MHKKITSIWPGLVRPIQNNDQQNLADNSQSQLSNQSDDNQIQQSAADEQVLFDQYNENKINQINEDFKNLYWSRFIVVNQFEHDVNRKHPLAPDILEELQQIAQETDEDTQ